MPQALPSISNDFSSGDYLVKAEIASSVTTATTLGPWHTPSFGGQSADIMSVWFNSTADFDILADLETAPMADGPWVPIRSTDTATQLTGQAAGLQALHCAGNYVRLIVTPTTLGSDLNIVLKAKALG